MTYEIFAEGRDGSQKMVADGLADRDAILTWLESNSISHFDTTAFHVIDPEDNGQGGPVACFVRHFDGEVTDLSDLDPYDRTGIDE